MLYCRDEETGEHLVTHGGEELRFATRAEALAAARRLVDDEPGAHGGEETAGRS